jgi:coiled-coil domain-containing protein 55
MSLKFGLGGSKKSGSSKATKKPLLPFGDDPLDEDQPAKTKISQFGDLSSQKKFQKNVDKALEVDPSIYDYDAAYDAIQASNAARKAAEREQAEKGEAKYMENLLKAKTVREKDYLRAKEGKMQRERETEGDEFADKEKFVTGAYKRQQEELRLQEAAEAKKEEVEKKRRENNGQRTFLNNILEQGERKHGEDVAAASSGIVKPAILEDDGKVSEADKAKELNAKGANITLTDDGEVADRRQLLSAGLNVIAKPKSAATLDAAKAKQLLNVSLSTRPGQHGSRERQTRMMEAQLEEIQKRKADEDAEETRQREHAAKSQKTASDIGSARERYLQRKAAAAAAAENSQPQP